MIIKKIKLENIRSYENQEIVFPKGSTILSGDIGSGKTSILLAIEFALFGLQPGQKGSALLRNGETEGLISLEIEIDNKKIIIERGLKKAKSVNQSQTRIEIDGRKEELSITELKNRVLELLNYPSEFAKKTNLLYRFTVYTPQEEMKQIILESPETRLDTLRHIFGIDKYKKIRENTEILTIKLRENKRNYEGQIKDLDELKAKLEDKKKNILMIDDRIVKLKGELEIRKKERESAEGLIKDVEEKIKEKERFEKEAEKTRIMLFSKKEALNESSREKEELQNQIEEIKKQLESSQASGKLAENLFSLNKEIEGIKKLQLVNESEMKEIELKIREKRKYEQEAETLKMKVQLKRESVLDTNKEISNLAVHIDNFNKISFNPDDFPVLERKIKSKDQEIEEKNKMHLKLLAGINTASSRISELENSKKDITKLVNCPTCFQHVPEDYKSNVLRKFDDDIFQSKKEVEAFYSDQKSLINEIDKIKKEIASLKINLEDLERLKIKADDIKEKSKRLDELNKQKSIIEQDILILSRQFESCQKSMLLLKDYDSIFERKNKENRELIKNEHEKQQAITDIQRELDRQVNQKANIIEKEKKIIELENRKKDIAKSIDILEVQLEKLKESASLLKKYELLYESRKKELDEARRKERDKEIETASMQKEKEMSLKLIEEINLDITSKENVKKKLLQLSEIEDWLSSSFLPIISFTERNIMLKLREEFSKLFNEWFNILVPENFAVRLDEDFTPVVEQLDYQLDYSFLSGGERTAIALAYRLALNQVLNSLLSKLKTRDLVILDEPTEGFSEQQLDKMRDVLSQLKVNQLIIVSHESKIESFVENIIKFTKIDGITKVVG